MLHIYKCLTLTHVLIDFQVVIYKLLFMGCYLQAVIYKL
jgi:hypothetical protein